VKIESAEVVVRRILRAAEEAPGAAVATDGDGTLWSGDVGEEQYLAFIESGEVTAEGHAALVREARRHGVDAGGDTRTLGRRIYDAYVAGTYPEEPVCELMAYCFAGKTRDASRAFASRVLDHGRLETRFHPELAKVLAEVRRAGIELFLVSASPLDVIVEAGRRAGFDEAHIIASTPVYAGDVVTADVERPIPYGPGKAHHLRRRIGERPFVAAFGDNAFDLVMLREAKVPVAVRAKARLRQRAAELPELVELEPCAF